MNAYGEHRSKISDGDVILTRAKPSFLSRLIRTVQGHGHTHCALAKWDGVRLMTREFREFRGYDERPVSSLGDFDHVATKFKWGKATERRIREFKKLDYSYLDAALAAFPIPFIGKGLICSEFVGRVLQPQIKLPPSPTPGDISDWFWEHDYPITKVKHDPNFKRGAAMKIDEYIFYSEIRQSLFKGAIPAQAFEGLTMLLNVWQDDYAEYPIEYLAYLLGTVHHETARTYQPVEEYGSDAYKERLYGPKGKDPTRAKRMGNTRVGDGVKYCGRGYVQMTWKINYRKAKAKRGVDFVRYPDKAMDPEHAAHILYLGCIEGWWTGRKLSDYLGDGRKSYISARRVVNGLDKATKIAGYAKHYERALNAAMAGEVTARQLRKAKSTTVKQADRIRDVGTAGGIVGGFGLLAKISEIGNKFKGATESISGLFDWVFSMSPALLCIGGAILVYFAIKIIRERKRREDDIGRIADQRQEFMEARP